MVDSTPTGIDGLDEILNGGLVTNSATLLTGNPGSGKTILSLQYLYNGIESYDEKGLFLAFEENADDVREAAESVGLDRWGDYVAEDMIKVYDKRRLLRENDFSSSLELLLEDLEEANYDRLVLDSLTMFELFFDGETERRRYLLQFTDILKSNGLTALLTNEQSGSFAEAEIGLEHYLTDGNVYLMQSPSETGLSRYVWIAKMRKKAVDTGIFPIRITDEGIEVHDGASGFSLLGEDESPF